MLAPAYSWPIPARSPASPSPRFATIDEMDVLITDAGADAEFIRQVQAQNVRVIIA